MVFKVPELDTDSSPSCSTRSFFTIENSPIVPLSLHYMSNLEHAIDDTEIGNLLSSLSSDDLRELITLLKEKRTASSAAPPAIALVKRDAALPKWTGKPEDMYFYLECLETRVEMDMEPYIFPAQICMDMIDTLPDDKKCGVES